LLSALAAYLIYALVEPTYEAVSLLRAEPTTLEIYNGPLHGNPNMGEVRPYLQTQVQLMKSNKVLEPALSRSEISRLKMVRAWQDPKADLRDQLQVKIVDNTYVIQVALSSRDANEAAEIVNAVVDAYLEEHAVFQRSANKALKQTLDGERAKLESQIAATKEKLEALVKQGNVSVQSQMVINKDGRDDERGSSFVQVAEGSYANLAGELMKIDLQLLDKQAERDTAAAQYAMAQQAATSEGEQRTRLQAAQLEDRIKEEFRKDPDVQPLIEQINEAREVLERNQDLARNTGDPAVGAARRQVIKLSKQWEELWRQKHDEIAKRLQTGGEDQRPEAFLDRLKKVEADLAQLVQKRAKMREMIGSLKVQNTERNSDQLEAQLLQQDLSQLRNHHVVIKSKLAQIDFEMGQETYRIVRQDKADVPKAPSNNKRIKYMAMAPVGVLGLMLGLFLLLEIKAERVADPDALSTRVQSEVYALPPLPTTRAIRKRADTDMDDQIEQFIQRLDHLRFAVCGNPAELEKGRCVLITSAIGGEGKTTLAAQLAARCGNAGMSTLLIDADLRRTGLCSLLDIPEGPGLSDALLNDEPAPTELVVPVQGGTFHLLPAGTPIPDTSRILQNRKLGLLIAQFRQLYDLVIIDSPPVLPVPDALVLGRWVDGAVLAVRYDISRFPQVERARRQLDGAGIAVLGTVINGMKNSDSYYGRYSYGRRRSPQADSSAAL
jgi:capsular exopolysaccharide synthesis family protein